MGFSQIIADGPLSLAEYEFVTHSKQELNWIGFFADAD
jgi:hypothetical protein